MIKILFVDLVPNYYDQHGLYSLSAVLKHLPQVEIRYNYFHQFDIAFRSIKKYRPDLEVVDIRGNIEERLGLIESGRIDALVVAHAALIRLGLEKMIAEIFNSDNFIVHPKQGSLTLVTREDKWQEVKSILSAQAQVIGS